MKCKSISLVMVCSLLLQIVPIKAENYDEDASNIIAALSREAATVQPKSDELNDMLHQLLQHNQDEHISSMMNDDMLGLTAEVAFVREKQIDEYRQEIADCIRKNNWLRFVTKCGLSAGTIALLYVIFKDLKIFQSSEVAQKIEQAALESQGSLNNVSQLATLLKDKFPDWQALQDFDVSAAAELIVKRQRRTWGDSLFGFFSGVCSSLLYGYTNFLLFNKIFHKQSVQWFAQEKTELEAVYEELAVLYKDIEGVKKGVNFISIYQADRYVNTIIRNHNAMVMEVERIIAYIHYKVEQMNLTINSIRGDALVGNFLFKRINDVAQQLHDLKAFYEQQEKEEERILTICKMFDLVYQFSRELNSSLGSFARFEKEVAFIQNQTK